MIPPSTMEVQELELDPKTETAQKRKWKGVITEGIIDGTFSPSTIEAFPVVTRATG